MTSANSQARPFHEVDLQANTASIGASPVAGQCVVTNAGYLARVMAAAAGTTTGTITVQVSLNNGSDLTSNALLLTAGSNARAGSVLEFPVGVSTSSVFCNEGDILVFTPSGGGGASIPGTFGAVIRQI